MSQIYLENWRHWLQTSNFGIILTNKYPQTQEECNQGGGGSAKGAVEGQTLRLGGCQSSINQIKV